MNRLELQIIQYQIKVPLEAEAVEMDTKEKHRVRRCGGFGGSFRAQRGPQAVLQTKQDEVKLLIQYLQKHKFFKDLPSAILASPWVTLSGHVKTLVKRV